MPGRFRIGIPATTPQHFSIPDQVVQLGFPPGRIDLLTSIQGVSFEEAWVSRQSGDFSGEQAWFIDLASLIRNKRASGRPQDIADLDALGAL